MARPVRAWSQFLRSQADAILAYDFFTADLLDGTRAYVLAVIEHTSGRIRILGVTARPQPCQAWRFWVRTDQHRMLVHGTDMRRRRLL
jgi:hypothetical protein